MAKQSQIKIPSITELKAAYDAQQAPTFDPTKITQAYATGMTLGDVIASKKLERQKTEEELKKEIQAALNLKKQKEAEVEFATTPTLPGAYKVAPVKGAEAMFDQKVAAAKSQEVDTRGRNYIRQLFTIDGQNYAVLGKVDEQGNPVVVPVGAQGETQPFIKPQLPAEQVEKTGGFEALTNQVDRLRAMVTDPKTQQISETGKGLIGAGSQAIQKTGTYVDIPGVKEIPEASNFYQLLQDLKNQIIYLRSGKQINEEEYKRLLASMPSEKRREDVFLQNLDNFELTFKTIMAERAKAFEQAGYRNPPPVPEVQQSLSIPGSSGLTPEQRRARIAELKAKKVQGR